MVDLRKLLPPAPISWRTILSLNNDGSALAVELRAQQWAGFARELPVAIGSVLALCAVLTMNLAVAGSAIPALLWLTIVTVAVAGVGALGLGFARSFDPLNVQPSSMRFLALCTAGVALVIDSFFLLAFFGQGVPFQFFAFCATLLAMVACAVFLFSAAPLAALVHLALLMACYAVSILALMAKGLAGPTTLILPAVVGAVVGRGVLSSAAARAREVQRMMELRLRGDMIAMLLAEVEQHGRDWLWEIDADQRLKHVSQRFAEQVGPALGKLSGKRFMDRKLKPGGAIDCVRSALAARQSFRNLVCSVEIDGETRWWALSGSPRHADDGAFLGFMGIGADVTEARRNQEQIERMATSDGLTGLANRSVMRGRLQAALDEAKRTGGACALVLFDLDRFKAVNDTLGHPAGDALLRIAAERLSAAVPAEAACARLGGDEFALVLPGHDGAAALALVERLIVTLSQDYMVAGSTARVSASAGIATGPHHGGAIDELMRCADLALYQAKADGRSAARLFDSAMQTKAELRARLEQDLRLALRDDQLSLAFQPIYNLASGEVRAFEALLRWRHPELGPISPADFIPVAEESGLIHGIGEWVVRTACAWAKRWPAHVGVAVNLSPSQLLDPKLPGVVLHALAANGIAPHRLELEITENVFLNEGEETRTALAQLSALGVRLGLDDFGTGYSSLGYLRNTMFDTIKIDRSFVRDAVVAGSQSAEIVRHIVSLANNLGMETVAEGAETEDELDTVRQLGCGNVQGFLMGKPMAPEDATALVEAPAVARAA